MDTETNDRHWMGRALELARTAQDRGEVPVGAVVVCDDVLLGEGYNCPIETADPTAHAEVMALRSAGAAGGNYRLPGSTLYVTLEPCLMCIGAMAHARVARLVYGAPDSRSGRHATALDMLRGGQLNHRCEVLSGVLKEECSELLTAFFRTRRGGQAPA